MNFGLQWISELRNNALNKDNCLFVNSRSSAPIMVIICTAKIANTTVGHIDHAMAYAVGFQNLGHKVYVMDYVGSGRCVDGAHQKVPFEQWHGRLHFEKIMKSYGLWPRCCLIYKQGEAAYGMSFKEASRVAKKCDLLITRSGQIHRVPEIFEPPQFRAYFDGNPGMTQYSNHDQGGQFDALDRYEFLFTLGFNIGREDCSIPTDGHRWHPMPRPVILPMWPMGFDHGSKRFTTISTWKGRATFQWGGKESGEKSDNWMHFVDLPLMSGQEFEIAMRMNSSNQKADQALFQGKGWVLTDPRELHDLNGYRQYIGRSRAEFSVAHNRYVEFSTGWFSDRSALYLASGKPVLVQSTGMESSLPTGKGLLTFHTMEEAIAGVEKINKDYRTHCKSAREIAVEIFDSEKILRRILTIVEGGNC